MIIFQPRDLSNLYLFGYLFGEAGCHLHCKL